MRRVPIRCERSRRRGHRGALRARSPVHADLRARDHRNAPFGRVETRRPMIAKCSRPKERVVSRIPDPGSRIPDPGWYDFRRMRSFPDALRRRLTAPLPGLDAQLRMAPNPRMWPEAGTELRPAAALLL